VLFGKRDARERDLPAIGRPSWPELVVKGREGQLREISAVRVDDPDVALGARTADVVDERILVPSGDQSGSEANSQSGVTFRTLPPSSASIV
jgi:hypothetical protein